MGLSINQILQKSLDAHIAGRLKEAKKLYQAILQLQPKHPEANHNLGVLAFSATKIEDALLFFKIALENNSKNEQFWISYIDALIKSNKFNKAKQFIENAKKHGLPDEKINKFTQQLILANKDQSPTHNQLSDLVKYYQKGQFKSAEKLAISLTTKFPNDAFSWKILGGLFKSSGRMPEALIACEKAVQINPKDDQAYFNLGNIESVVNNSRKYMCFEGQMQMRIQK